MNTTATGREAEAQALSSSVPSITDEPTTASKCCEPIAQDSPVSGIGRGQPVPLEVLRNELGTDEVPAYHLGTFVMKCPHGAHALTEGAYLELNPSVRAVPGSMVLAIIETAPGVLWYRLRLVLDVPGGGYFIQGWEHTDLIPLTEAWILGTVTVVHRMHGTTHATEGWSGYPFPFYPHPDNPACQSIFGGHADSSASPGLFVPGAAASGEEQALLIDIANDPPYQAMVLRAIQGLWDFDLSKITISGAIDESREDKQMRVSLRNADASDVELAVDFDSHAAGRIAVRARAGKIRDAMGRDIEGAMRRDWLLSRGYPQDFPCAVEMSVDDNDGIELWMKPQK